VRSCGELQNLPGECGVLDLYEGLPGMFYLQGLRELPGNEEEVLK
jgi:hypothetical protein